MVTTARAYAAPAPVVSHTPEQVRPAEVVKPKPEKPKKAKKVQPKPKKRVVHRQYKVTGNKQTWMKQAGIPASQWKYVDYIVTRESGWRPNAVNPNGGACGLAQALPCSKLGPNWADPVHALKWQYAYVKARYGGYAQAYSFWVVNHWY